ncbi:MAG: hypothetical protein K1X79_13965 [Oligoflexia bacterium]|nr:hypothetical protein [Oligoflexia bacterium]
MRLKLLHILCLLAVLPSFAWAGPLHGEVTKGRCPITCKSLGIPRDKCHEWRDNGLCYVEDLTKPRRLPPPAAPTSVRIEPTATPYTALRRPPIGYGQNSYGERPNSVYPVPRPGPGWTPGPRWPVEPGGPTRGDAAEACRRQGYLSHPRIDIYRIKKTGNIFGDKYKVRGVIEGVCLVEAGYYEDGRREDEIAVVTTPEFRRFEFEVRVRADQERQPEIRAYNIQGDRDVYEVGTDEFDSDERDDGYWGYGNRRR